jgi:hypothetical protein
MYTPMSSRVLGVGPGLRAEWGGHLAPSGFVQSQRVAPPKLAPHYADSFKTRMDLSSDLQL